MAAAIESKSRGPRPAIVANAAPRGWAASSSTMNGMTTNDQDPAQAWSITR